MPQSLLARLACVALLLASVATADARFLRPDLEKVPVERLVKNLEEMAQKEPKNAQVRFNLAHVHAMAYASKADSCDVNKALKETAAWFGFTPSAVPFKSVPAEDKEKLDQAKKHLLQAIDTYKEVLKINADNLAAQLGLAWCIEQSGDKTEAVKAYRKVIETGWEKEGKMKFGPLGGNFITKEAATYLVPLLDKDADKAEIETLTTRIAQLNKLPRPVTPIAVPLKDGLTWRNLEDRRAAVRFDADGSGLGLRWTWITPDAGWLVHDPQHRGKITSGLQLFGNVSFWCFWENGYQALRALDDNRDGQLSGRELDGLAIWHDLNGDGVCQPGEVRPLSAFGIVSLSCDGQPDASHPDRIPFSPRGVVFRDGTTRPTYDLILQQR